MSCGAKRRTTDERPRGNPGQVGQSEPVVQELPNPDDWYAGVVVRTPHDDYSFAELSNGTGVYIGRDAVTDDTSHRCLQVGDEVALRLEPNDR